jgi:hypothetical protein
MQSLLSQPRPGSRTDSITSEEVIGKLELDDRRLNREHIWSLFFALPAARVGSMANDPFLRRRLLPPSRYRRGRAWAPALPSAPGHQPPHGPGQEDVLVLVHA